MSKQSEESVNFPESVAEHQALFPSWVMIPMRPAKKGTDDHKKAAILWKDLPSTPPEARRAQNVAVRCGEISGIFVVCVDAKDNGCEAWEKLVERNGRVVYNHRVSTPSDGFHAYFAYDERLAGIPNAAKFELDGSPVGIDVRTGAPLLLARSAGIGVLLAGGPFCPHFQRLLVPVADVKEREANLQPLLAIPARAPDQREELRQPAA